MVLLGPGVISQISTGDLRRHREISGPQEKVSGPKDEMAA